GFAAEAREGHVLVVGDQIAVHELHRDLRGEPCVVGDPEAAHRAGGEPPNEPDAVAHDGAGDELHARPCYRPRAGRGYSSPRVAGRAALMAKRARRYWLLKSEPGVYAIDDL